MRIQRVDVSDAASVSAWFDCYLESDRFDRPQADDYWTLEDTLAELREVSTLARREAWAAVERGRVVAAGACAMRLRDNQHRAELGLWVRPSDRRRGHGTALLAHLEQEAAAHGRTVLGAEAAWPWSAGHTGDRCAGREFARARGYELGLTSVHRMLRLPVHLPAALAGPPYDVRTWRGPVPADLAAGWAALDASLETEAPMGDLELEDHVGDVAGLREAEALVAAQGRMSLGAAALAGGEVVGYTQLLVSADGTRADQEGTLVRADHRGHGLGLVLKVANLRQLPATVRTVSTYNADENAHMVAVNDALGFVPVEYEGEFQKRR